MNMSMEHYNKTVRKEVKFEFLIYIIATSGVVVMHDQLKACFIHSML